MADDALLNLNPGTLAADSAVSIQNTSAATRMERAAYSELGGLVLSSDSLTTANLTASVGTLHQLTIAGLTAIRDFILPDTAKVGERVALYVVDGDPDYEVNIKTAATGSLLNGVDHSSTAWSKVFIKNETMLFRCVVAGGAGGTDWIVENDGRLPCVLIGVGAAEPLTTNGSWTEMALLDTATTDIGAMFDSTNERSVVRRDGKFIVDSTVSGASIDLAVTFAASHGVNGVNDLTFGYMQIISNIAGTRTYAYGGSANLSDGDYITHFAFKSETANRDVSLKAFSMVEQISV